MVDISSQVKSTADRFFEQHGRQFGSSQVERRSAPCAVWSVSRVKPSQVKRQTSALSSIVDISTLSFSENIVITRSPDTCCSLLMRCGARTQARTVHGLARYTGSHGMRARTRPPWDPCETHEASRASIALNWEATLAPTRSHNKGVCFVHGDVGSGFLAAVRKPVDVGSLGCFHSISIAGV